MVDEGCHVLPHTTIGYDAEAEADAGRFYRSPGGAVLVTSAMINALAKEPLEQPA